MSSPEQGVELTLVPATNLTVAGVTTAFERRCDRCRMLIPVEELAGFGDMILGGRPGSASRVCLCRACTVVTVDVLARRLQHVHTSIQALAQSLDTLLTQPIWETPEASPEVPLHGQALPAGAQAERQESE